MSVVVAVAVVDVDVEEGCGVDCVSGCLCFGFGFSLGWRSDRKEGGWVGRQIWQLDPQINTIKKSRQLTKDPPSASCIPVIAPVRLYSSAPVSLLFCSSPVANSRYD